MIKDIQDKISKIKKEHDICILAHSYQAEEIQEIADFTGDSFQLSLMGQKTDAKHILMCGVRFMAETVKILSPEKKVVLVNPYAGCPMAEQMSVQMINEVKTKYPDYAVVSYINTTAALKTISDVCVTSSSAVKIVSKLENKNILFIPDCNLGSYVAKQLPDKNFKLLNGGCPVHAAIKKSDVNLAKQMHPDALLLVHPECTSEVVQRADYVGATSGIVKYAVESDHKEFIIGTEISIAEHLQYLCPDKMFYPLSSELICTNMKCTTLMDVYNAVNGIGGDEIILDDNTLIKARKCIDKMIELG